MARVLTGIQSSGAPHLGNLLGAILPALDLSKQHPDEPAFFFIADLHSLTSLKDPELIRENTYKVAMAWLACGLDPEKDVFYRQSDVPEVTELTWYLLCFTPYGLLKKAHAFKEKSEKLGDVNAGLFTYPVLMAADILLYDAEIIPVGKDQKQHLEIARDIALKVNHHFGEEIFVIPEPLIREEVMIIPGTDGQKMSKSYHNTIDVFLPEKELRKQIMRIVTDSTPLEAPKDPNRCTVFKLYRLLAPPEKVEEMRQNYLNGGYGYGQAKQALFEVILERFKEERKRYQELKQNPETVENILRLGRDKAREIANAVLNRVRKAFGFSFQKKVSVST